MSIFTRRKPCTATTRTPEQHRQDEALVLFSTLFTVFMSLFVVLFS